MPAAVDRAVTASAHSGIQCKYSVYRLAYSAAWLLGSRA